MTSEIAGILLRNGLLGLVALVQGLVIRQLYKQLQAEHEARLNEARETTKQLLAVSERVHEALSKLHDLAELFTQGRK